MNRQSQADQGEIQLERMGGEVRIRWPEELPDHPRVVLGGDVPLTNLCAGILARKLRSCPAEAVAFLDVELAALAHALASFLGMDYAAMLPPGEKSMTDTSARPHLGLDGKDLILLHGLVQDEKTVTAAQALPSGGAHVVAHASLLASPILARELDIAYVKPMPEGLEVNR